MKKILLVIPVAILIGAGCNQLEEVQEQAPAQDLSAVETHQEVATIEAIAEPREKSDVLFYYENLPYKYLPIAHFEASQRNQNIEIYDQENYYISVKPLIQSGGQETGTMAVFIKPDGSHVIAVEGGIETSLSFRRLYLLTYNDGVWTDVTDELLPEIDFDEITESLHSSLPGTIVGETKGDAEDYPYSYYFILPRYGTNIQLHETYQNVNVVDLLWRNGKFILSN